MTGSCQIVTIAKPMAADKSPLIKDPAEKLQMIVMPNNIIENISSVRKFNANSAKIGATKNKKRKLTIPPIKLAVIAMPNALPALPLEAIG